jgi:4-hydroxy-tetrahydrodipicolinate reductase
MAEAPIDLVVAGAAGRMGEAVARSVLAGSVFRLVGLLEDPENPAVAAAKVVAVVHAPNLSRGVALLTELAIRAARTLPDFEIEIEERHHRDKMDSPSGTALSLAAALAGARGLGPEAYRHGREGRGRRAPDEIGIHALRGGDWVGEHTIVLAGGGETVELRHRAESRAAFVRGALAAARFVATAPPGRYGMPDVLDRAARIAAG